RNPLPARIRSSAVATVAENSTMRPMLRRYCQWSATNEYLKAYTLKKPSVGKRDPPKNKAAARGARVCRRVHVNTPSTAIAANEKNHCHARVASTSHRG